MNTGWRARRRYRSATCHTRERVAARRGGHSGFAFRDALRGDPALAGRYAALEHDLAARFRDDGDAYTQHKTPFVREVVETSRNPK